MNNQLFALQGNPLEPGYDGSKVLELQAAGAVPLMLGAASAPSLALPALTVSLEERKRRLADFKASHGFRDVVEAEGYPVSRESKMLCPFHADGAPSLHVYADHGHCFSCGWNGDHVKFIQELHGVDFQTAAARLIGELNLPERPARPVVVKPEKPRVLRNYTECARQAHLALLDPQTEVAAKARAYFESRGLVDAIRPFRLGVVDERVTALPDRRWQTRTLVPYMDRSVNFVKARKLLESDPNDKYLNPGGVSTRPFNWLTAMRGMTGAAELVITEGELDCISASLALPRARIIGVPGVGNLSEEVALQLLGVHVTVMIDPDTQVFDLTVGERRSEPTSKAEREAAGLPDLLGKEKSGRKLVSKLVEAGALVRVAPPMTDSSDMNDLLIEYGPEGLGGALESFLGEAVAVRPKRRRLI